MDSIITTGSRAEEALLHFACRSSISQRVYRIIVLPPPVVAIYMKVRYPTMRNYPWPGQSDLPRSLTSLVSVYIYIENRKRDHEAAARFAAPLSTAGRSVRVHAVFFLNTEERKREREKVRDDIARAQITVNVMKFICLVTLSGFLLVLAAFSHLLEYSIAISNYSIHLVLQMTSQILTIASRRGEARATIEPRRVAPLHPAARGVVLLRDHFEADYHINGADGRMVFCKFFSYPKVVLARTARAYTQTHTCIGSILQEHYRIMSKNLNILFRLKLFVLLLDALNDEHNCVHRTINRTSYIVSRLQCVYVLFDEKRIMSYTFETSFIEDPAQFVNNIIRRDSRGAMNMHHQAAMPQQMQQSPQDTEFLELYSSWRQCSGERVLPRKLTTHNQPSKRFLYICSMDANVRCFRPRAGTRCTAREGRAQKICRRLAVAAAAAAALLREAACPTRVYTRRDACLHVYKRYKRSILSSIGRLRALDIWSVCSRAYVYALDAARRTNFLFYDPPPAAAARNFFLHTRAQYLEISLSYYCYSVGPAAPIIACDSQKVIAGGIFAGYATRCGNHNTVEEPLYTRARGKVVSAARRLLPIHTLAAGHSESRLPRELADVITPHEEPELDCCSGMSESLIRPYHAKSHRLFSRELRSTAVLLSSLNSPSSSPRSVTFIPMCVQRKTRNMAPATAYIESTRHSEKIARGEPPQRKSVYMLMLHPLAAVAAAAAKTRGARALYHFFGAREPAALAAEKQHYPGKRKSGIGGERRSQRRRCMHGRAIETFDAKQYAPQLSLLVSSGTRRTPLSIGISEARTSASSKPSTARVKEDRWQCDHPGLRGTPLAMLAAQCNKLSNKSPPPLADAAVGKGFHPWKKSPQSSGSSPQHPSNTGGGGCTTTGVTQRPTATSSAGSTGGGYARAPVTSCASTAPQYASDLYFPGTASTQPASDHHHQSSLLGKVEGATLGSCSVYGRHPYESWPFNTMPGASHGGIKAADGWWDVHGAATGGWLDVSGTVGVHAAQMANYSADYSTSLALAGNHLLSQTSAGHNLLQDTYKSMLPGGPPSFGLHHHGGGAGGGGGGGGGGSGGGRWQHRRLESPERQQRHQWQRRSGAIAALAAPLHGTGHLRLSKLPGGRATGSGRGPSAQEKHPQLPHTRMRQGLRQDVPSEGPFTLAHG
ncbi:unnamed protein product [Trichogramma brassicae]|uniref:Uncharacterized protein n=1 Tax=Trichogramma brassicae TaxID=86971 RepID=A0A6H5J4B7_9HYME|nr:unnamed protein product [Trichogramma brassicae]